MKHMKPSTESYLALLLVCVGAVPPLVWGLSRDFLSLLMTQASPVCIFAWLFAISGARRASGVARLAAIASLTVLVFDLVLLGLIAVSGKLGPYISH